MHPPKQTWLRVLMAAWALSFLAGSAIADEKPAPQDQAVVVVRLPADAKLMIESNPTTQTGSERVFTSPSLSPGKKYVYTLEATWKGNGREIRAVREAVVRAGEKTLVDFTVPETKAKTAAVKTRTFRFTYRATVVDLAPGKVARIWLPVPTSNEDQDIQLIAKQLPAEGRIAREPKFGNQVLYMEAKAGSNGQVPLSVTYQVTRREVHGEAKMPLRHDEQLALFLQPDAKVPISGKPLELIKDKKLPDDQLAAARVLYEVVNSHMRYSKEGTGWGRGDSVWACESGYGNCSDFHSLFISLARAKKIPAKFEIGFPLPDKCGGGEIPGYHCWAKFRPQGGDWVPVDISEANKNPKLKDYYFGNLTEDRITFSTGRDLDLIPKQAGEPLNFFVYPYVEVDSKPYPADKVQRKFAYQDIGDGSQDPGSGKSK